MKKWLFSVSILVLFLTVFSSYRHLVPQKVDYFILEPRDFLETLVAAGRVKFSQEVEMAFRVPGTIQVISAKEGEKVRSGDLLISLDDTLERNQVQLARTELNLAEINLRKLIEYQREVAQEEYRRAVINRQATLEEYERAQILFQSGTIPQEELNRTRRSWETALSLENAARLNLENIGENGPGFLEMKAQVEKASLELAQAEVNLKEKHLRAPTDGVVISLKKNPGEFVQAGEVVAVLGKNPLQVVTSL
ncbi:MAG: HlyD family secretion protein, partial [Candidatus Caldatribacteriaceae bacterium]